jgi:hypothetical protein
MSRRDGFLFILPPSAFILPKASRGPVRRTASSGSAPTARTAGGRSDPGPTGRSVAAAAQPRDPPFFLTHSSSIFSRPICSNNSAWTGSGKDEKDEVGRRKDEKSRLLLLLPTSDFILEIGGPLEQLLLPGVNEGRVDVVLPGQFVDRAVALQSGQGDLGLERRRVFLPLACHCSPLSHEPPRLA